MLAAFLRQETQAVPAVPGAPSNDIFKLDEEDSDAGTFGDQLLEILKRGASNAGSASTDDTLETLLTSGSGSAPREASEQPAYNNTNAPEGPSFPPMSPASPGGMDSTNAPEEKSPSLEEIMGISALSDLERPGGESRPQIFPPAQPENIIPELPEDTKPRPSSAQPQDDFLRMFPGAR
jgi:hypothetical protein